MQVPRNQDELLEQLLELARLGPDRVILYLQHLLELDPLPPDVARGELLLGVGEYAQLAGDLELAEDAFRAAVAEGDCSPDPRCFLAAFCLEHGDAAEGEALVRELVRDRPDDPHVYTFVGEAYEASGDLATAAGWYTDGALRAVLNDDIPAFDLEMLLLARRRVRQAQGLAEDGYDALAREVQQRAG